MVLTVSGRFFCLIHASNQWHCIHPRTLSSGMHCYFLGRRLCCNRLKLEKASERFLHYKRVC